MKHLLKIALDWAVRSFGPEHMADTPTRTLRIAEEAIELAQAAGVTRTTIHRCVDMVYDRPIGDVEQEIGGVLMTAYLLCAATGRDPEEVFLTELRRVLAKSPKHFAERNRAKIALGMQASRDLTDDDFCPLCGVCVPAGERCMVDSFKGKLCPHAEANAAQSDT